MAKKREYRCSVCGWGIYSTTQPKCSAGHGWMLPPVGELVTLPKPKAKACKVCGSSLPRDRHVYCGNKCQNKAWNCVGDSSVGAHGCAPEVTQPVSCRVCGKSTTRPDSLCVWCCEIRDDTGMSIAEQLLADQPEEATALATPKKVAPVDKGKIDVVLKMPQSSTCEKCGHESWSTRNGKCFACRIVEFCAALDRKESDPWHRAAFQMRGRSILSDAPLEPRKVRTAGGMTAHGMRPL